MMEVVYVYVSVSGVKAMQLRYTMTDPYLGANKESPGIYSPLPEVVVMKIHPICRMMGHWQAGAS